MHKIKRIGIDDYNKLAVVFSESDIIKWGIKSGDKIDLDDCLLVDGENENNL